jgi:hypothetical protein
MNTLGLTLPSGFGSAYQWWTEFSRQPNLYNNSTQSQTPVAGAIFVARGGIYDGVNGHIGIVTGVNSNGTFNTMEQNAGTWRYVGRYTRAKNSSVYGFIIPKKNPAAVVLAPHQRVADKQTIRRAGPSTSSAIKQPALEEGTVGDFDGWIRGEMVDGVNIWYRGALSGDWFWSGALSPKTTTGLKDLNSATPPTVQDNQRQVDPVFVRVRSAATTTAAQTGELAANSIVTPEGWVTGQSVDNIAIWYKVPGGYAWAGGFTREDSFGLKDLNPTTPDPVDPPVPDPTGPGEDVGPGPVLSKIGEWSRSAPDFSVKFNRPEPASVNLEFPSYIIERVQTPIAGFNEGREGKPVHAVLHHGAQPNLSGLVSTLSGPNAPTAQYAIKDYEIVSMVDERDTAATNTRWMSNTYGINLEIANDKTTSDKPSAKSHEAAAWVVARAALRWGWKLPLARMENVFGHSEVSKSATTCPGELDMVWITNRANEIIEAANNQETPPKPDYSDLQESINGLTKIIQALIDLLKKIFNVQS